MMPPSVKVPFVALVPHERPFRGRCGTARGGEERGEGGGCGKQEEEKEE